MKVKFLGTSSGEAIPREDCDCSQCKSKDKKDKRLRSAILINKKILIDAGPDIKKQLSASQIEKLEIVLITHDHQDHIGGIKDLLRARKNLRILRLHPGQHFKLLGIDIYAFRVRHSNMIPTVGVEVGQVIYLPDTLDLDTAEKYLKETKVAILDGSMLGRNFAGHLAIDEIIGRTKGMKNLKKIYFTHNGHTKKTHKEMDKLVKTLGDKRYNIAYDGLEIEV